MAELGLRALQLQEVRSPLTLTLTLTRLYLSQPLYASLLIMLVRQLPRSACS